MSKYMIEIEDEPFVRRSALFGEEGLYRAKGFNSLVFDQVGLGKLTPLDKELEESYQKGLEEGKKQAKVQAHLDVCHDIERVAHGNYQKGLDDAWECARKIVTWPDRSLVNSDTFDLDLGENIFTKYSASRAIEKLKAYEEQQKADEIKIGDEVRNTLGTMDNAVGYFFGDSSDGCYKVLRYIDGKFKTGIWNKENCERTGKHSYAVERMVAVMEEGAD